MAGEFLQDQWQKLILCMAVLLIVVSSNVGAYQLLGPKLWSPLGKCVLALVYTATFAGLGAGLVRWGAERAGRIMLLTTLIVVPANFMLAGQMKLLMEPTAWGLTILAVDAAALFVLIRVVASALELGRLAGFLSVALFVLSAFNVAAAPGSAWPWSWQFAVFLAPAAVFLAAVFWLTARGNPETMEATYLSLGLLAFAFVSGLIRTGNFALGLAPTLYALPVMTAALACAGTSARLDRFDSDAKRKTWIRFAGLVLSGLAFAAALARPPGPSALYSGNTLATALIGLLLYAALLRAERLPPYLYFSFGALLVAYFGAFYFAKDLMHAVEEAVRKAAGYEKKLPEPFRAINGLVFSPLLAGLSIYFRRVWNDDRLARHCHYLGVPFSIAVCIFSGFEPKAGLICLSGYAVLYAIAARVFSEPRVIYLAAAATAGAAWFGTTLQHGWTFAVMAVVASAIGLGEWLITSALHVRETDDAYRRPLFHAALIQATVAIVLCGLHLGLRVDHLVTADFAAMAVALAISGLTLALLTGPYPSLWLAEVAIACGLGVWVSLVQWIHGEALDDPPTYAMTASVYGVGLIAFEEAARAFAARRKKASSEFQGVAMPRLDLFARAIPIFEVGLVIATAALALTGFRNGPELIFTYTIGAGTMLWATRLRRSERLVDLGLALAVAAALFATAWRVGWRDPSLTSSWLGMTCVLFSLALWLIGRLSATRLELGLYVTPCRRAASLLTWPVLVLALIGQFSDRTGRLIAIGALAINALGLVLLALDIRRANLTYRAIASAVIAVCSMVNELGWTEWSDFGLFLILQALVLSAVGFACRARGTDENGWDRLFARPLFNSALGVTLFASIAGFQTPATMLLAAVSFLLMVKGKPARYWLYPSIACVAMAVYFGVLKDGPQARLVTAGMVAAYQLWLLGLLVRRAEPALIRWLALPNRDYDYPFFNSGLLACLIAVFLRVDESVGGTIDWSASWGLALNVAVFMALLVKPYPHQSWIHIAVALVTLSVGLAAYPRLPNAAWWAGLGMVLANAWCGAAWLFKRFEAPINRRCGLTEEGYPAVVSLWSQAIFAVATGAVATILLVTIAATLSGQGVTPQDGRVAEWAGFLLTIVLGGAFVVATWWKADRDAVAMGLFGFVLLAVWWLAAPVSPLVTKLGVIPRVYLPLSTGAMAVATVAAGLRLVNRPGWRGAFWKRVAEADSRERLDAFALQAGLFLACVAVVLTRLEINGTTVLTLLLATVATGLAAWFRRWVAGGYATALAWCASGLFAALVLAERYGVRSIPDRDVMIGGGLLAALASLWFAAGFLRRAEAARVAVALEKVALLASAVALSAVVASAFDSVAPGHRAAIGAVAVLCGLALFAIGLLVRWGDEWLVYAAQGNILGAYLYFRWAFPIPAPADALVLTLFGYLDLGLAEVMHRVGLERFARPTRYFAIAMPVLPLALGIFDSRLEGMRLFFLFTAAAFYGIACLTLRWKSLGYASAVFTNAFLWLLWGRIGWTLTDRPQFFLIPVGLSAILFAEIERKSLGREATNGVRGIGLTAIYLSLAFPVWQFASLGAWVALLVGSLAAIFIGIALRAQVFLWLGLVVFVLDVVYQLTRMGMTHTLAKWGIMLALGLLMFLFVALNEKKRIVPTMREYMERARQWD